MIGYGDDEVTETAVSAFREIFGAESAVFFVATGTAANTLAVASLTEPWHRVLCHTFSHWNEDESTAPERLTHCRTTPIHPAGDDLTRLTSVDVHRAGAMTRGDVHQPAPGVLTISNPTEFGTLYTPEEMTKLCTEAHSLGYRVHVDGARFANTVAALGQAQGEDAAALARALTVEAGVDAMSFGGTKNGLAFGEAVLFFPQGDGAAHKRAAEVFPFHRKSTGHLLSKHRFISAPFAATLSSGAWLTHANHANTMAHRLAHGLNKIGVEIPFAAQTNGVFVTFPDSLRDQLWERGHRFYPFGEPDWRLYRLMCSFDTTEADVDGLIADASNAKSS